MSEWLKTFYTPFLFCITALKAIVIRLAMSYNSFCGQGAFVHWGIFVEKIPFGDFLNRHIGDLDFSVCRFYFGNLKKCLTNTFKPYIIGSVSVFADGTFRRKTFKDFTYIGGVQR